MAIDDTGTDLWTVAGAWEYPYAGPFDSQGGLITVSLRDGMH
jgi:hypothetical protein